MSGRSVLITGHTGFKGGWLSIWLDRLGADVHGYALDPPTTPSMFDLAQVGATVHDHRGDVRDIQALRAIVTAVKPEIIFHLAAQPLVRASYADPLDTWATNVMGTANLLQAVNEADRPCAVVVVSSDKCYDNIGSTTSYREDDPLGGSDPYSASKGATELVTRSWRDSYFPPDRGISVASARSGNVIGGGDWAHERILPDCVRAFVAGELLQLRNPGATRPWQHVLEPLGGYFLLATHLLGDDALEFSTSWNFGPHNNDVRSVKDLVALFAAHWGTEATWAVSPGPHPTESAVLSLDCEKAAQQLRWYPTWTLAQATDFTAQWYQAWQYAPTSLHETTIEQIQTFEQAMDSVMG